VKQGTWTPFYYPAMTMVNHRPLYCMHAEILVEFGLFESAKEADAVEEVAV